MANYRLKETAERDLERIWLYGFENWGLEAADNYQADFIKHFEELAAQPLMYPIVEEAKGYRRSLCGKESVYYRVNGDTIEIMTIIGRQDVENWL